MIDRRDLERFVPVSIPVDEDDEETRLEHALDAVAAVERGQVVVLPEGLAETVHGGVETYVELALAAWDHDVTIVASLPLPPDLTGDLVGTSDEAHHEGVAVFTRHGEVHVPQARLTPILDGIAPYDRLNRVRIDVGRSLLRCCFLVGSDLWALARVAPEWLRFDLIVCMAALPSRAIPTAHGVLDEARRAGFAGATLLAATATARDEAEPLVTIAPTALTVADPAAAAIPLDQRVLRRRFAVGDTDEEDAALIPVEERWADATWEVRTYPVTVVA